MGLPIIEMVTTRVWEQGEVMRGRGPGPSRGHRALSAQQVVTWRPLATTPPPAPRQGGNNYRGRALTHPHLHTPCTLQLPGGPRSPWRPLIVAIQTLSSSPHSRRSLRHFIQVSESDLKMHLLYFKRSLSFLSNTGPVWLFKKCW